MIAIFNAREIAKIIFQILRIFFWAIMVFCVAQKSLRLDGVAKFGSDMYRAQLGHMLEKATESPEK